MLDCKRKAAVVMDIFKGKTTADDLIRQFDLTVAEVEGFSIRLT
ncbi:hypothetical protein [Halomonas sp. BC04]|nr:hypothetical protein [Halomonas sp. BC04]EWG99211.1 hypothetical protein Q427_26215 [Halomonas sp. BC04]